MADCCNGKACEIDALRGHQSQTLKIVLGINAAMFAVELAAGLLGNSISLVADSLDMLAMPWCRLQPLRCRAQPDNVWPTRSGWPDILVGLALAALFLRSALFVLREAVKAFRAVNG